MGVTVKTPTAEFTYSELPSLSDLYCPRLDGRVWGIVNGSPT